MKQANQHLALPITIGQIPRNVSLDDAKTYETINNVGVPVRAPYPVINPALYQNPYWIINRTETNDDPRPGNGFHHGAI